MKTVGKKLLSAGIAGLMLACAIPSEVLSAAAAEAEVQGDVNGDGKVNADDLTALKEVLGSTVDTLFAEGDQLSCDVTGEGIVDARDLYALSRYLEDGTAFPDRMGGPLADTVTMALTGGACLPGETVTLDLSFVDWTKDIIGFDLMLYYDNRGFEFVEGSYLSADGQFVCEGEGIKLTGVTGDQSLWRGDLARLTFRAKSGAEGDYGFSLRGANVYSASYDVYQTIKPESSVTVDSIFAPVALTANAASSKRAELSWQMPFDSQQISLYRVYRDGEQIAETADTFYTDLGLEPDTDYEYAVSAVTYAGEETDPCVPLKVRTAAPEIVSVSFPAEIVTDRNSDLEIKLAQSMLLSKYSVAVTAPDGTKKTETIKLNGAAADTLRYHVDLTDGQSGEYSIAVKVTDVDNTADNAKTTVTADASAPAPVTLKAFAGSRNVTLTWSIAAEADAVGYTIYQSDSEDGEFVPVAEIGERSSLSTVIPQLTAGTEYFFAVTATDVNGNEGAFSNTVSAVPLADTVIPEITYFAPTSGKRTAGILPVEVRASDDTAVARVAVLIAPALPEDAEEGTEPEWEVLFETEGAQLRENLNTADFADGIYQLKAMAYDADGNESSGKNIASVAFDNTAPAKVSGLRLDTVYPTQATLAWDNVEDNDFSYFKVVVSNGSNVQSYTVNNKLGINLSGLVPDTVYIATVTAVDQTGNEGEVSDVLRFVTTSDLTAPVITYFSVSSDYLNRSSTLYVSATATDTAAIRCRYLQYSQDQENWKTISESSLRYDFSIYCGSFSEGPLYLRVYATDAYGNTGDPEEAVIHTVYVDLTPTGPVQNLTAEPNAKSIRLSWEKPEETDIGYYIVQRSASADGSFTTVRDNLGSLSWEDTTAEFDQTYYYRVAVVDYAGNLSAYSEPVSAMRASDSTAPSIDSAYLSNSGIVCEASHRFQIIASDNVQMDKILLTYRLDDSTEETDLTAAQTERNSAGTQLHITVDLPEAVFGAQKVTITAVAFDTAGNASAPREYVYPVNNSKAALSGLTVTPQDTSVQISFKAEKIEDTTRFVVFRSIDGADEIAIASISKTNNEQTEYSYSDSMLDKTGSYVYRVAAYQRSGNISSLSSEPVVIHSVPKAKLSCDTAQMVNAAYYFDGRGSEKAEDITLVTIDFGDGTVETVSELSKAYFEHTYTAEGSYQVTLTCTNANGISNTASVTVTVSAPSELAQVTAFVTTTDGHAASYASVYVDLGTDAQMKYETDENGVVTFITSAGTHDVGVFGNGYLPATKTCEFISGADNEISFSVVANQLVDASFNITRMTLDEIVAAGINVADPANSHVVKINVSVEYESVVKDDLTIYYDMDSGVHIVRGGGNGYRYEIGTIRGKKEIDTIVLLRMPTEVSFLKEFFNVQMIVINNADAAFPLEDCSVTLNTPYGLTLMESAPGSAARTAYLGTIAGGGKASVDWIVRGDVRGSYTISADFQGTLAAFDEPISQRFESQDPIVVLGQEAATITVNIDSCIRSGGLLVEMLIENKSSIPLYELSTDFSNTVVEAIGRFSGSAEVSMIQTRVIGTDKILKVIEPTEKIDVLNPGEAFSVLYRVHDFSDDYKFTLLKSLKDSLSYTSTSRNVTVRLTSDVHYVDVNSILYGINIDPETEYLLAFRNKAGQELAGVNVEFYQWKDGGEQNKVSGTTDERGRFIMPRHPAGENWIVRAKLEGYNNHYDPWFQFPEKTSRVYETIIMEGEMLRADYGLNTAKIYTNGYSYKGDAAKQRITVNRGEGLTFEIRASVNTEAEHFELWKDDTRIKTVDQGGTTVTFSDLNPNYMPIGTGYHIRVFSTTGDDLDTSIYLEIGKIKAGKGAKVAKEAAEDTKSDNPTPFSFTHPEITSEWGIDLTMSLPDLGSIGEFDPDAEEEDIEEATGLDIEISEDSISVKLSHSMEVKLSKHCKFNCAIYFEVKAEEDGDTGDFCIGGTLGVEFGGEAEFTLFQTVEPIPFYIQLGISLEGGISYHLDYTWSNIAGNQGFEFHIDGEASFGLRPMLAIGVDDIAHVGIYGEATLSAEGVLLSSRTDPHFTQVKLAGAVGLECDILGWWGYELEFWSGEVIFYDYDWEHRPPTPPMPLPNMANAVTDGGDTASAALTDESNYRALTEADFAEAGAWNGSGVLQQGIHVSAAPVLISDGETAMLVWLAKDVTRGIPNASYAVFSVYDSETQTWSEPKAVDSNSNADLAPTLYADENGIRIAYQESSAVYETTDISLRDYAAGMRITAARYDAENGSFTDFTYINPRTEGAYISKPVLAEEDGSYEVIYTENANGLIFGNDGSNAILCTELTEDGLTKVIGEDLNAVTAVAAGKNSAGKLAVAYTVDSDSDFTATDDTVLSVWTQDGVTELASGSISSPAFAKLPGSGADGLVWYQNGALYSSADLTEGAEFFASKSVSFGDQFLISGDNLILTGREEDGTAVYTAVWDPETESFGEAIRMEGEDGAYLEHLSIAKVGDETIYTATKSAAAVGEDGVALDTALVAGTLNDKTDLTLVSAAPDYSAAAAGKALPIKAVIRNNGTLPGEKLMLSVRNENGAVIAKDTAEAALASGKTAAYEFSPVLPETFTCGTYTLELSSSKTDSNPDDNTAALALDSTDLRISVSTEYLESKTLVTIFVENESCVPASAVVHITPMKGDTETMTLISEEIAPHRSAFWVVDSADMLGDFYHSFVTVEAEASQPDFNPDNNIRHIALSKAGFDASKPGDINLDGSVDTDDAIMVLKLYTLNMIGTSDSANPFTDTQKRSADVLGTGSVSSDDAVMVLKYYTLAQTGTVTVSFEEYLEEAMGGTENGGAES